MFLEKCTYPEVEGYLKENTSVLIPLGSLENHGKHLPLGTDTLIPQRIAELVDERMPGLMIAPTFHYGSTDDLAGFAGTVTLGIDGLKWLLTTVCDQLFDYGFRHFIVLNGHGGNSKSVDAVGMHIYDRGGYLAYLNWWQIAGQLRPEWRGGHGGGEETAAVMGVDPSLVRREYLDLGEGIVNDLGDELPSGAWTAVDFGGASVNVPRHINAFTDNGWLGHGITDDPPGRATEEWGREMLEAMADYTADFARAFARVAPGRKKRARRDG